MGPKIIALQNECNIHIIFCVSNIKNIFVKFYENVPNLSEVSPIPLTKKKKTQKSK